MDTLRGPFDSDEPVDRSGPGPEQGWDAAENDGPEAAAPREMLPDAIGQDERRMQVRAYNHWASLLGERLFPLIEDLNPAALADFGPYSVLLDFTAGMEDPVVRFVGERLARECGGSGTIARVSDVPSRSLLSRITDHYMQILANQAPIGFEAEFVNQRGVAILYRGILLPYSSNEETIDFIYGVINWKEVADQLTADELLLEIDQALDLSADLEVTPGLRAADPVTEWADSPAHEEDDDFVLSAADEYVEPEAPVYAPDHAPERIAAETETEAAEPAPGSGFSLPAFAGYSIEDEEDFDEDEEDDDSAGYSFASLSDYIEAPAKKAIDPAELPYDPDADLDAELDADMGAEIALEAEPAFDDDALAPLDIAEVVPAHAPVEADNTEDAAATDAVREPDGSSQESLPALRAEVTAADTTAVIVAPLPGNAGLADWLAAAREMAHAADATEDRSRSALYAAVSRAYDFSLAAHSAPEEYAELLAESGLTVQDRAPMTPVVKLVFGPDYDKTRLTEYAAVLSHAHRLRLARGSLAELLGQTEGGLKAVVKAERQLRREEQGKPVAEPDAVREALAEKLRELEPIALETLDGAGAEFALVLIRRDEIGCAELLAEVPEDIALIERAARKLLG